MAKSGTPAKATIRSAIYTRKSSEEGLEQDFNSLDAQREACDAYIKSQKQEGWVALPTFYDDGGLSGGSMKRPALTRLLADIAAGKIDTVVVYKVDRLTRSLADFAKIVDQFDDHDVAFVAVTQQFNTTTSMGRLTLNMLLSFAQFEREVTSERIRDKIAASKKKGMWMGGVLPLGYDIQDKKLVINETEAETVRHIFTRYVDLGSVNVLRTELTEAGIVSKRRVDRHGRVTGGAPFARGALYLMLQNCLYRGEVPHKEQRYPGQHQAIIEADLWDRAQAKLTCNRVERKTGSKAKHSSLLTGLIYDDQGERLVPTHANKKGTRYRYYVSQPLIKGGRTKDSKGGRRLPAGDLERLIENRLMGFLGNASDIFGVIEEAITDVDDRKMVIDRAAYLAKAWPALEPHCKKAILQALVDRIEVQRETIILQLRSNRLIDIVDPDADLSTVALEGDEKPALTLTIPARFKRTGMETTLLIEVQARREPDRSMLSL
ncbi:MAG: recombinase family protein, partial [Geminicoccaceae bacterium]